MNTEARHKARLWLASVFIVGVATGGVFGYSFAHFSYAATRMTGWALTEPELRAKRVADVTKELGLTPEQAKNVHTILQTAHEEMKVIRDKSTADVDAVRQRACGQIREMLTPEQRPKYEAMLQRRGDEGKKQQAGK